jgi:serine/threonine protein kinase/Flp pilus assembly protein TadD
MTDLEARLASALADRYRLERALGEGGMAIVYLAEDLRHHRKVAVKVLRPELAPVSGSERFLREIEIAAGLRHPHILPLYDSGEADGLLYYVMPLVEGESLRARLARERQLPIDDALRYAREVADALSYAHARGVVHRDIKPENILIESGHAVVADFGIAKAVAAAGATTLTGVGMAIGTPAYMSPEQAAGGGDVDGRSDLYSLACVLYEMLAGQPPFTGATTESLVRQHIMASAPPVTQFRPAVSALVSDALMRAMAKAPADRFNPVGQFSTALDHSPIATAPVPSSRRGTLWPIAAAVVVVLAFGGGAWSLLGHRATPAAAGAAARTIAVLPFDNLSGDSSIAPLILGMHAEMITQLTKLGGLTVTSRSSALQYRGSHKSEREIASELGVATVLTGSAQRSGDQVRFAVSLADAPHGKELWAESYDRPYTAATVFAVQGDIARQVAAALRVKLSDQQERQIARVATSNLEALDLYYRALALWDSRGTSTDTLIERPLERAIALDSSFVAAWSLLAQARSWLLRLSYTTDTVPAWAAMHRTQVLAPGSLEATLAAGNYRYYALGDFAGALRELAAADSIAPNSSDLLDAMALLQRRLGHWDEAIVLLRRAIDVDPRNPKLLADLGETYAYVGRQQEALAALERSLAMAPTAAKTIITEFEVLQLNLGDTARARSFARSSSSVLPAEIRAWMETELAMYARDFGRATSAAPNVDDRFYSNVEQRSLAVALASALRGDSASARLNASATLRTAQAELERRGGQRSLDAFGRRSAVEAQMGVALALSGEREAAVRLAEKAAAGYGLAQDAVEGCHTQRWLALTYTIVGRRADAIAVLRRVHRVHACPTSAALRLDPVFDGLRAEPEFQRLVAPGQ